MYRSKDGKVSVDVVQTLNEAVLPAADFSMINVPVNTVEALGAFEQLFNTPTHKHVCLAFVRHTRQVKLQALANIIKSPFLYLDTVHIWYEKPSSSSNIGFLPIAEDAYVLYKGEAPTPKNTVWFGDGQPNATNMWGVAPAEREGRAHTHYKHFAWEIGLLLYSICQPVQVRKFIYALDEDHPHVLKFCREYNLDVHIITKSDEEAKKIISRADIT